LAGIEIGVGAQHEDAVEPFLDREVILAESLSMFRRSHHHAASDQTEVLVEC
jgi:hypothetical protein